MISKLTTITLRQGQKHPLVARLHRILEVLGYEYDVKDPFVFSEVTTKILQQFQEENNIQATGIVDKPTAVLLEKHYSSSDFGKPHTIVVVVTEKSSNTPLEKLLVQVLNKDNDGNDKLLEENISDAKGQCTFEFDEMSYRKEGDPQDVLPNLYFRMFDGRKQVFDTEDDVKRNLPKGDHQFSFKILLISIGMWRIKGSITDVNGNPVANIKVEAWDEGNRTYEPLAVATSCGNGSYHFQSRLNQLFEH